MAREAALYAGEVMGMRKPSPPSKGVTSTFTPFGAMDLKCASKSLLISPDRWLGTSLMEIFACAVEGSTVFAPVPV